MRLVSFDDTGKNMVSGDEKGQIYLYKIYRNEFSIVKGQEGFGAVTQLCFVPSTKGCEIVAGFADGTILCIDTITRHVKSTISTAHGNAIHSISTHPHYKETSKFYD